jgi:NADPH:quinone reductase-like Zn-dependent oxidoreductase
VLPAGPAICFLAESLAERRLLRVRAVVLSSFAGIEGLELSEVPSPTPAEGEELVRVRAASLGPWDLAGANGAFVSIGGSSEFPQVQGWDFAGETVDGRGVMGFVAQPWMGAGAMAEEISVPTAILTALPDSLGFPEASALPVSALTARLLVDAAGVGRGDLVLVSGAAGMVGGFALQLAAGRGARVLAAVRSSDADEAQRLGAEMTFDTAGKIEAAIRSEWPDGVDACIDTIGLGADGLDCVRDDGAFVTSITVAVPDAARGITPATVQVQPDAAALAELADRAVAGELTVRVGEVLPLERFREGYDRLQQGGLRGKVVLAP